MQYGKDTSTHQSIRRWCRQFQATGLIFLVGKKDHVKDHVYRTKVRDLQILHTRMNEAIASVWREVEYRLDIVRATNGAHIQVY